jgi:hypothetical protein
VSADSGHVIISETTDAFLVICIQSFTKMDLLDFTSQSNWIQTIKRLNLVDIHEKHARPKPCQIPVPVA